MTPTRLAVLALLMPLVGGLVAGTAFWIGATVEDDLYQEHCVGTPTGECVDMPSWHTTFSDSIAWVPFVLAGACLLVGIALGVAAVRKARAAGSSLTFPVFVIVLDAILWLASCGMGGLMWMMVEGGGGPHGRPLRILGRATSGRARKRRDAWSEGVTPAFEGLDAPTRARLAEAWLSDARLEHAAVAAFARLTNDLLAVGAPPSLVEGASRAAADEVRHARACFALASAYAGVSHGPDALPEARLGALPASRRGLLTQLLRESVIDGVVGEGIAAETARAGAAAASDPVVRGVLEEIAREEGEHAALGRDIAAWARAELGAEGDALYEAALVEATRAPLPRVIEGLEAHGRPSRATYERARADVLAERVSREPRAA